VNGGGRVEGESKVQLRVAIFGKLMVSRCCEGEVVYNADEIDHQARACEGGVGGLEGNLRRRHCRRESGRRGIV